MLYEILHGEKIVAAIDEKGRCHIYKKEFSMHSKFSGVSIKLLLI